MNLAFLLIPGLLAQKAPETESYNLGLVEARSQPQTEWLYRSVFLGAALPVAGCFLATGMAVRSHPSPELLTIPAGLDVAGYQEGYTLGVKRRRVQASLLGSTLGSIGSAVIVSLVYISYRQLNTGDLPRP